MAVGVKSKIEKERKKQIYESEKRKVVGPAEGEFSPRFDRKTGQLTDPVSVRAKRRRKGEEGHKPTFVGKKYHILPALFKVADKISKYSNKVRKAVFHKD